MTDDRASEIALNRALWAVVNERFTDAAADDMWAGADVRWGLFAVPDRDLGVARGRPGPRRPGAGVRHGVLLGLARAGRCAPVVASTSPESSSRPRVGCKRRDGPDFPLVQADAERAPFADGRFDLVVSEHGVAAWCDPDRWLPEAARLLRPGGRLVFLTNSNLSSLCVPAEGGVAGDRLLRGQRETYRVQWPGGGIEFHPSHGDWVRLLRGAGFVVEAMHEIYAPADGADHPFYEIVTHEWASRWPAEELWVARLG